MERCEKLGAEIVPIDFSAFEQAAAMLYAGPWVAERLLAIAELADRKPEAIHEVVRGIILGGRDKTAAQSFQAFYELAELIRQAESEWAKMDVLLLPTAPTTFTIKDMLDNPVVLNSQLGTYTNFVNLMDLAALAVPAGFRADGIPFGVTLIGPALSDGLLASLGDRLHRSLEHAPLGATRTALSSTPAVSVAFRPAPSIQVAVVGAHLSGQPLNIQLTERDAKHVETTRTAPGYRLFALADTSPQKPGLVFDGAGAGGIEVELWEMEEDAFGSFVALIPAPLCLGSVRLADGRTVKGFLCETYATVDAEEITDFGGWRAWLGARGTR